MPVHVSIHDVSPAFRSEVDRALDLCHAHAVKPALLVVPNFHGQWPLLDYPDYCARLAELQRAGHEIYLHGYFHKSGMSAATPGDDGKPAGAARFFAQRVVSGGEAEMSDVTRAEAEKRLDEGEKTLQQAGLTIDGYVPPAWSMPAWLLEKLGARGYRFTEDHMHVYDPKRRQRRASLVLNFASRTPARLASSVAFCRLATPARAFFPSRIALHPGDMNHALLRHEADRLLAWGGGDFVSRGDQLIAS